MQPNTAQPTFEAFGVDAAEYQDVYLKAVSGSDCYGELLAEWYGSMSLSSLSQNAQLPNRRGIPGRLTQNRPSILSRILSRILAGNRRASL